MNDFSDKTIETYRENFDKYKKRTPNEPTGEFKEWMDAFASLLPSNAKVFELGSATGRDARYLREKHVQVFCTDVIPEALKRLSQEGFETDEFDFRNQPKQEWLEKFDGVFANAVLLHASGEVFVPALKNLRALLKDGGLLAFSLKYGEGDKVTLAKMDAPRYFRFHSEDEIREIMKELSLDIVSISTVEDGKWLHVIVRK